MAGWLVQSTPRGRQVNQGNGLRNDADIPCCSVPHSGPASRGVGPSLIIRESRRDRSREQLPDRWLTATTDSSSRRGRADVHAFGELPRASVQPIPGMSGEPPGQQIVVEPIRYPALPSAGIETLHGALAYAFRWQGGDDRSTFAQASNSADGMSKVSFNVRVRRAG